MSIDMCVVYSSTCSFLGCVSVSVSVCIHRLYTICEDILLVKMAECSFLGCVSVRECILCVSVYT